MKDINLYNLEFNFYDDKENKYIKEIPSLINIKEYCEKENKDRIYVSSCIKHYFMERHQHSIRIKPLVCR